MRRGIKDEEAKIKTYDSMKLKLLINILLYITRKYSSSKASTESKFSKNA